MNRKHIQTDRIRNILLFGLCCLTLTLTACITDEQVIGNDRVTGDSRPAECEIVASFSLVSPSRPAQTRGLSEADENAIRTVRLLMFRQTNGVMTYCLGVNGENIREASSAQKTVFDVKIPAGTYDIAVLANAQTIIDNSNITPGDTKTDVLNALVESGGGKWKGSAVPMWGRKDGLTVDIATGLSDRSDIEMVRMMAKIDVEIASSAAGDFTLTDIRLYNYSSRGALVPDLTAWPANNLAVSPSRPAGDGGYGTVSTPLVFNAGDGVTATGSQRIIYTYEAPAGSKSTPSGNTCLVIGGRYRNGAVTYYRVDFAGTEDGRSVYLPLLRNSYYLIRITGVSDDGYASPGLALTSPSANMNTVLLQWTEKGMNNVVFDGEHMLGVSTNRVTLPADAHTAAGAANRLTVLSTAPSGWEIEKITGTNGIPGTAPWLTLSRMSGASGTPGEIAVYTEKNTSLSDRTGYIYIRSQKLQYCVEVVQGVTPGFGIEVTDGSGRTVEILDFTYSAGQVGTFRVEWKPATALMTIYVTQTGGGFSGTGIPDDRTTLTGGSVTYTITSNAVNEDRLTRLDFTLTDGVTMEVKSLFLRRKQ